MITTEQELNRFSIASFDFEKAIEYAGEARMHRRSTLAYDALLFAAIVCYYRPFSANERRGATTATAALTIDLSSILSEQELALHGECKTLRNKALAHSEHRLNPTRLNLESGIVASRPFSLFARLVDLEGVINLATKLHGGGERARAEYVLSLRRGYGPRPA